MHTNTKIFTKKYTNKTHHRSLMILTDVDAVKC